LSAVLVFCQVVLRLHAQEVGIAGLYHPVTYSTLEGKGFS